MTGGYRSPGLLVATLLAGCAAREPFYVELPLTPTPPHPNEASVPAARIEALRTPEVVETALPNGLVGHVVARPHTGVVSLVYVNRVARLGADYVPTFLGDALLAGAYTRDGRVIYPVELAGEIPLVGTGTSGTTIRLSCRAEHFNAALELLAAVVQRPVFDATFMTAVRSRTMRDLSRMRGLYEDWWLAKEHAGEHASFDAERVADQVGRLDSPALQRAHRELYQPASSALIVVGDVSPSGAVAALRAKFGDWQVAPAAPPSVSAEPGRSPQADSAASPALERAGRKILVFEEPGYPQVTLLQDAPPRDSEDAVAFELLSDILASHASSQLMQTLRFQQGHAYSIGARTMTVPEGGRYLLIETAVATGTLAQDLSEMLRALDRLRVTRVDAAVLANAKTLYSGRLARSLASGFGTAAYLTSVELGLSPPLKEVQTRLMATTVEDLQRVARRYFNPDNATVLVRGDAAPAVAELRILGEVYLR